MNEKIYPVRLSGTYAFVNQYPIFERKIKEKTDKKLYETYDGYSYTNKYDLPYDVYVEDDIDERAKKIENKVNELYRNKEPFNFFFKSNDIFKLLFDVFKGKNQKKYCNYFITLVIPNLRNLYWDNRDQLPEEEVNLLKKYMKDPLPVFYNIYNYNSINNNPKKNDDGLIRYQLLGSINPYDVVIIPLINFIDYINNEKNIEIQLEKTNIIIYLPYHKYDLWDDSKNKIIDYIKHNC